MQEENEMFIDYVIRLCDEVMGRNNQNRNVLTHKIIINNAQDQPENRLGSPRVLCRKCFDPPQENY